MEGADFFVRFRKTETKDFHDANDHAARYLKDVVGVVDVEKEWEEIK